MKASRWPVGKLAAGFFVAGAFAWVLFRPQPRLLPGADAGFGLVENTYWGEALLHGVRSRDQMSVSLYMPVSSIGAALLFNHASFEAFKAARLFLCAVAALLMFSLGCLLGPPAAAALAVLFSLSVPGVLYALWHLPSSYNHLMISLYVLLVAGLLAWRAGSPSLGRSLVLGLAIGATFLHRSSLAFLPAALVLFEWLAWHGRSLRSSWKHFLAVGVLPYLFLIPWARMNWIVHKKFIPFEQEEAAPNIVRGALGFVHNSEVYWKWRELVPASVDPDRLASLLPWAVGQILDEPLRYGAAFAARVVYVIGLYPLLFLLAGASLWIHRDRREFQALGLLIAYYVGVHCTMTMDSFYFWPLWPLLVLLAAALAARPWSEGAVPENPRFQRFAAGFLRGALAILLGFCLYALGTVSSYANQALRRPPWSEQAWSQALARDPDDAWLLFQRGEDRLARGDLGGALADYSASLSRRPGRYSRELKSAWVRMLAADAEPLFRLKAPQYFYMIYMQPPQDLHVLKAHGYLRQGRLRECRRQLRYALRIHDPGFAPAGPRPRPDPSLGTSERERLRYAAAEFAAGIGYHLKTRPASERLALLGELARLEPDYGSFWLERAGAALEDGQPALALRSLAKARGLTLEPFEVRKAERLEGELEAGTARAPGRRSENLPVRRAKTIPVNSADGIEKAEAALRAGDRKAAREALDISELARLPEGRRRRAAQIYALLGDHRRASKILDPLSGFFSGEAGYWIERAESGGASGSGEAAAAFLARAEGLRPSASERHRIAMGHQGLRDYGRARAVLGELSREFPKTAVYLKDLGLCEHLSGRREQAVGYLKAALALDPASLSTYLTLGAIQTEAGYHDEALKTYEAALAAGGKPEEGPLRDLLARSRRELLSARERGRARGP